MTNVHVDFRSRLRSFLEMPLSGWQCALGWCVATALFVGIVFVLGGPGSVDTRESVYGTWAVAHGHMACTYPSASIPGLPPTAPIYFLLSGGIAAIARIGNGVPFPSASALGPNCNHAFIAMDRWSAHARALQHTTWIGSIGWLVLMAGVIAWLRASGRGRCGWEPATLAVLACLPPVWMCVQSVFHPQDLLAMGLALCAMACARRGRWVGAGILAALAVLTQQFTLLVAAPLLVLAPAKRRTSYAGAALITGALVSLPLVAMTSGRALRAVTLGTGDSPSIGGTVVWELHLYGAPVVLLSRVVPVALSLALSWWASRRLGPAALEPVPILAVVALSLGLRLVFEQNLFGYYFMALTVTLVLLDVVRGHVRSTVVAWLAAVTIVFCVDASPAFASVGWGEYPRNLIPFLIAAPALVVILVQALRGDLRRSMWPWLAVAACAVYTWPNQINPFDHQPVTWFWQIVLVVPGVMLAAGPLLAEVRRPGTQPLVISTEGVHAVE